MLAMNEIVINITPVPKPRMTQSDRWKKRDCVVKYWEFKDELKALVGNIPLPHPAHIVFVLPMPDSWSAKKKQGMNATYHRQRPDADNLWKAWNDCLYDEDGHISDIRVTKIWGWQGQIIVYPMPALDLRSLALAAIA